ncbi:MAG: glutathione S-transferase family protein [Rhizobiales bacterium]|nr:glutathione S-transferase family protein [Rhizobacter sp.]
MSTTPQLIGFPVSPHVRSARIAFHEKAVPVDFQPKGLDFVATDAYGAINPFRKMPALVLENRTLFETPALMVYADATGTGPSLEPSDPFARARMWQFIGVAQNHLYPAGVMKLYFHSVLAPLFGMATDAAVQADAVAPTTLHLDVLESAIGGGWLAGGQLTHADLYCGAMVDYIARTAEGAALIDTRPRVRSWLASLRARESFTTTFAPMLVGTDKV